MKTLIILWFGLALSPLAHANVVGTDVQQFNPTTNGLDFVTVQSSETLRPGFLNIGLFSNYATNTLPRYGTISPNYSDALFGMDFNLGVGILPKWDAGLSLPSVIGQSVTNSSTGVTGQYGSTGFTELKLNTKYRFSGDDNHGLAAVVSTNINFIQNNPYVGTGGGPTFNFEFVGDTTIGKFAVGANVGYRLRSPGSAIAGIPVEPYRNQYIASLASSYHVASWDTKFIFEMFGSFPVAAADSPNFRQQSSIEALLGAKHDLGQNVAMHLGFGKGLATGVASPDIRVYIGFNVAVGPLFGRLKNPIATAGGLTPTDGSGNNFSTNSLYFGVNSYELEESGDDVIGPFAEYLRKQKFTMLVIEGHTDSIGSRSYNIKLSEQRANTIKKILVSQYAIAADKIQTIGQGPDFPVADNGNFQGRSLNRRVEFRIER